MPSPKKPCLKCGKKFPITRKYFYHSSTGRAYSYCKTCHSKINNNVSEEQKQKTVDKKRERRQADSALRERGNRTSRLWRKRNPERLRFLVDRWNQNNPERYKLGRRRCAGRRAEREKMASPAWADKKAIKAMYAKAVRLAQETGIPHNVDHIEPLYSELVCGLHVESNLQVITSKQNRLKHTHFVPYRVDINGQVFRLSGGSSEFV